MPKRVSMFDREFEEEGARDTGFRCTLRLSSEAYRKLREAELSLVLQHGLRPGSVTRSIIVSKALEALQTRDLIELVRQSRGDR